MYGPIGLEIKNILRYFVVAIVVRKATKMASIKNEEIFTISHDREVLPISGIFIKELYRCDFKFLKKKRRGAITIYCITRTV